MRAPHLVSCLLVCAALASSGCRYGQASFTSTVPGTTFDPNGTVFRIVEYEPGVAPRSHRTDSIDYAVVLSGEIDMELDDGVVHLGPGDVVVQRGTIHNWVNRGTVPCVIAFALIGAKPVTRNGKPLEAMG